MTVPIFRERKESYTGSTVLVVGAARSGTAAAAFLLREGARVILTDVRTEKALSKMLSPLQGQIPGKGELVLELGGHRAESFRRCDFVVLSPGAPLSLPFLEESRKSGIPILAEVELAGRHLKGKILGITGTNGKTTTTSLVGEMLRASGLKGYTAGNIGVPLISFVEGSATEDVYATELSSFQLETIDRLRPFVASILNVTPNHLDRYSGFESYAAAKRRIFMNQTSQDFAVLNADNPITASMAGELASTPVYFSRTARVSRGTFVSGERILYSDGARVEELAEKSDIRLRGAHNLENVLAAAAIGRLAGASPRGIRRAIREFIGVEHRLEWVAEIQGVQYFNDSKATSVDATIKSLESFSGNIVLILGGRDKGADFTTLLPLVRAKVEHLVVLGEASGKIRESLKEAVEISNAGSMQEAVALCHRRSRPGDIVLLAPACASFDMFEDYEHRGRVFKETVMKLQSGI